MTDAEFTSYTIIEFPSEAEMEFFLTERISKSASLRDRMKKNGMKKWVTSRVSTRRISLLLQIGSNTRAKRPMKLVMKCLRIMLRKIATNYQGTP